jgi:hypothetical protein
MLGRTLLSTNDEAVARPLPTQDNTTQTRTNTYALSEIRAHDLSVQTIKAYTSDRVANGNNETSGSSKAGNLFMMSLSTRTGV